MKTVNLSLLDRYLQPRHMFSLSSCNSEGNASELLEDNGNIMIYLERVNRNTTLYAYNNISRQSFLCVHIVSFQ